MCTIASTRYGEEIKADWADVIRRRSIPFISLIKVISILLLNFWVIPLHFFFNFLQGCFRFAFDRTYSQNPQRSLSTPLQLSWHVFHFWSYTCIFAASRKGTGRHIITLSHILILWLSTSPFLFSPGTLAWSSIFSSSLERVVNKPGGGG